MRGRRLLASPCASAHALPASRPAAPADLPLWPPGGVAGGGAEMRCTHATPRFAPNGPRAGAPGQPGARLCPFPGLSHGAGVAPEGAPWHGAALGADGRSTFVWPRRARTGPGQAGREQGSVQKQRREEMAATEKEMGEGAPADEGDAGVASSLGGALGVTGSTGDVPPGPRKAL